MINNIPYENESIHHIQFEEEILPVVKKNDKIIKTLNSPVEVLAYFKSLSYTENLSDKTASIIEQTWYETMQILKFNNIIPHTLKTKSIGVLNTISELLFTKLGYAFGVSNLKEGELSENIFNTFTLLIKDADFSHHNAVFSLALDLQTSIDQITKDLKNSDYSIQPNPEDKEKNQKLFLASMALFRLQNILKKGINDIISLSFQGENIMHLLDDKAIKDLHELPNDIYNVFQEESGLVRYIAVHIVADLELQKNNKFSNNEIISRAIESVLKEKLKTLPYITQLFFQKYISRSLLQTPYKNEKELIIESVSSLLLQGNTLLVSQIQPENITQEFPLLYDIFYTHTSPNTVVSDDAETQNENKESFLQDFIQTQESVIEKHLLSCYEDAVTENDANFNSLLKTDFGKLKIIEEIYTQAIGIWLTDFITLQYSKKTLEALHASQGYKEYIEKLANEMFAFLPSFYSKHCKSIENL